MVHSRLNYAVQVSALYRHMGIKLVEQMQRLATIRGKSFGRLPFPAHPDELKLFSNQRRILRAILTTMYKLFQGYLNLYVEEFLKAPAARNLRGHSSKGHKSRFRLAKRKAVFAICSESTAHMHCRSLDSFKDRLDDNWIYAFKEHLNET